MQEPEPIPFPKSQISFQEFNFLLGSFDAINIPEFLEARFHREHPSPRQAIIEWRKFRKNIYTYYFESEMDVRERLFDTAARLNNAH